VIARGLPSSRSRCAARSAGLLFFVLAGLAGCAPPPQAAPSPPQAAPARAEISAAEVQALIGEVAALRGVALTQPIPVEILDEERFSAAVDAFVVADGSSTGSALTDALSLAAQGVRKTAQRAMMQEQVIGFYNEDSRKVFLRKGGGFHRAGIDGRRMLLAHEIEHALQHQRFGSSRLTAILDEDARLARLAVVEGEASMVGVAYAAVREGVPIKRAIIRVTQASRFKSSAQLLEMHARAPLLARASATDRERLLFPYFEGMDFMIALYRAGGFPIIDRVFVRPPTTTEQVLHPEKYIAGEPAIPVRSPAAPDGYRPVSTGRMGELQTRALLSGCIGAEAARAVAEGWGGDAFTIVEKDGARAVLWSTVWDAEPLAARFEQALRASGTCWRDVGNGQAYVARKQAKVTFIRGLPDGLLPGVAAALIALPEEPLVPSPPLGDVALRPVNPPLVGLRGTSWQGFYQSIRLNLAAPLPPGFTASTMDPDTELTVRLPGYVATGILTVSDRITTPMFNERVLRELEDAFAAKFPGLLELAWTGNVTLPLGPALARLFRVRGTEKGVRVTLVPVCNGTGGYLFVQIWDGDAQRDMLDRWVMSFRPRANERAPLCYELDPD
jgi:hypothetical protein